MTAKGQVTLNKEVLHLLGLRPGDQVAVDLRSPGHVDLSRPSCGSLQELFGRLPSDGVSASIDDMNEAIEAGWSGKVRFDLP